MKNFPDKIGDYKIESLLNKGGMSLIYLGIHPKTYEPIAIKVLSSKHVSNPQMIERFMHEAEIIEVTNHPNIITLYGHGKWKGGVYIAMEFVQGLTLRQMILQEAMSLKRSLEIILQIAHALTHLHAHGIIHRDVKPENILLTSQGGIKVVDFGISQVYSEKESSAEKKFIGTPAYMSPEQRKNPLKVSFATDIYSLGVVAYELIVGRLSHGVIHLSNVPMGLQNILAKALQPNPADRYEDIVDFIKAVGDYMDSEALKKDMRGRDFLGDLQQDLREAQSLLVSQKPSSWNRIELALASNSNAALSSVYYDFLQLKSNVYNIVMGESMKTGVEGVLQIAVLKGMVNALAHQIERPTDFVARLSECIANERELSTFSFSLLSLYPTEDRFSYISCGHSPLWVVTSGSDTPQRFTAENPSLGSGGRVNILDVDRNWKVGDTLILHNFQAESIKQDSELKEDEDVFCEALTANLFLSLQKQAEAIFRQVSHKEERTYHERPLTLIGFERLS